MIFHEYWGNGKYCAILIFSILVSGCGSTSYIPITHQEFDTPDVPGKAKVYAGGMYSSETKVVVINDTGAIPPDSSGSDFSQTNAAFLKMGVGIFDSFEFTAEGRSSVKAKWQFLGNPLNRAAANEVLGSVFYKYEGFDNSVRYDSFDIFTGDQTITESDTKSTLTGFGLVLGYRINAANTVYIKNFKGDFTVDTDITQEIVPKQITKYSYSHSGTHDVVTLGYRSSGKSPLFWGIEASKSIISLKGKSQNSNGAGIFIGRRL